MRQTGYGHGGAPQYGAPQVGARSDGAYDSLFRDSGATFVPDPGYGAPPQQQQQQGYGRAPQQQQQQQQGYGGAPQQQQGYNAAASYVPRSRASAADPVGFGNAGPDLGSYSSGGYQPPAMDGGFGGGYSGGVDAPIQSNYARQAGGPGGYGGGYGQQAPQPAPQPSYGYADQGMYNTASRDSGAYGVRDSGYGAPGGYGGAGDALAAADRAMGGLPAASATQGDWSDRLCSNGRNGQQQQQQQSGQGSYARAYREQREQQTQKLASNRREAPVKAGRRAAPKKQADTRPPWNSDFADEGGWLEAEEQAGQLEARRTAEAEEAARQRAPVESEADKRRKAEQARQRAQAAAAAEKERKGQSEWEEAEKKFQQRRGGRSKGDPFASSQPTTVDAPINSSYAQQQGGGGGGGGRPALQQEQGNWQDYEHPQSAQAQRSTVGTPKTREQSQNLARGLLRRRQPSAGRRRSGNVQNDNHSRSTVSAPTRTTTAGNLAGAASDYRGEAPNDYRVETTPW